MLSNWQVALVIKSSQARCALGNETEVMKATRQFGFILRNCVCKSFGLSLLKNSKFFFLNLVERPAALCFLSERKSLVLSVVFACNCHNSGHYPLSCILFKIKRFGDRILPPSSDPDTETSSIYWAQLSRFHLKTDRIQSPKRRVLNKK
jgi:hypothetical protein